MYIRKEPKDAKGIIAYMIEFHPDRFSAGAVALSAVEVFLAPEEARI